MARDDCRYPDYTPTPDHDYEVGMDVAKRATAELCNDTEWYDMEFDENVSGDNVMGVIVDAKTKRMLDWAKVMDDAKATVRGRTQEDDTNYIMGTYIRTHSGYADGWHTEGDYAWVVE